MHNVNEVFYSQFSHRNMLLRKAIGSKTSKKKRFIRSDNKAANKAVGGKKTAKWKFENVEWEYEVNYLRKARSI